MVVGVFSFSFGRPGDSLSIGVAPTDVAEVPKGEVELGMPIELPHAGMGVFSFFFPFPVVSFRTGASETTWGATGSLRGEGGVLTVPHLEEGVSEIGGSTDLGASIGVLMGVFSFGVLA